MTDTAVGKKLTEKSKRKENNEEIVLLMFTIIYVNQCDNLMYTIHHRLVNNV